jgi:hypothetical protein
VHHAHHCTFDSTAHCATCCAVCGAFHSELGSIVSIAVIINITVAIMLD